MHKHSAIATAFITGVIMLTPLSQVEAQPLMSPSPMPLVTALPTATPSPRASAVPPTPTPAPTQSSQTTAPLHRSTGSKSALHDPELSGRIDYTFDAILINDSLKQTGIDTLPQHYRPLLELHTAGVEMFSIVRENDRDNSSIQIVVMQDPSEFVAKMQALARIHFGTIVNPMARVKEPGMQCLPIPGYSVGSVTVKKFSCHSNDHKHAIAASATLIINGEPIYINMHTTAAAIDDHPMHQIINELNSMKTVES